MRVGVLGNCQAGGFAKSLGVLAPGLDLLVVRLDTRDRHGDLDAFAAALADCDVLFTQPVGAGPYGPLAADRLVPRARRAILIPAFAFRGFHPDRVVLLPEGNAVGDAAPASPMGPYHSALAMAGFLEGVPLARLERLFNAFSYAALGYFDIFAQDRAAAIRMLAPMGYDFDAITAAAPAAFMHSPNHPKLAVLFAIARAALVRAGITPRDAPVPADDFVDCCRWPVYPELARALGCPAGLSFAWHGQAFGLARMLEASYQTYAVAGAEAWAALAPGPVERARACLRAHVLGLPPAPPRLSVDDVRDAYRLILGRACESQATAEAHARRFPDMAGLRRALVASAEFRARYAALVAAAR